MLPCGAACSQALASVVLVSWPSIPWNCHGAKDKEPGKPGPKMFPSLILCQNLPIG